MNMLGFGSGSQPIILFLNVCNVPGIRFAEGALRPLAAVADGFLGCPSVNVPSQVHAELQFHFCRFDVPHVNHPQRTDALVVGSRKFIAHERRGVGGNPQIVLGRTPVRHVVIDPVAAATRLLGRVRQLAYVAVVVVHPAKRHVLGNL